jgi:hypothetical protein
LPIEVWRSSLLVVISNPGRGCDYYFPQVHFCPDAQSF